MVNLNPVPQIKTVRFNYKQINREKWKRCLNIGVIMFALFVIIYLCFSMNLTLGKQPAQTVVDIPPVEESGIGPKGDASCLTLSHVSIIRFYLFFATTTIILYILNNSWFAEIVFSQCFVVVVCRWSIQNACTRQWKTMLWYTYSADFLFGSDLQYLTDLCRQTEYISTKQKPTSNSHRWCISLAMDCS